jgi:hypothetical protein
MFWNGLIGGSRSRTGRRQMLRANDLDVLNVRPIDYNRARKLLPESLIKSWRWKSVRLQL